MLKTKLQILALAFFSSAAFGGPSISGGVPLAPSAVIIQGRGPQSPEDVNTKQLIDWRIAKDQKAGRVAEVYEGEWNGELYLCVRYKTTQLYWEASERFEKILENREGFSLSNHTQCPQD